VRMLVLLTCPYRHSRQPLKQTSTHHAALVPRLVRQDGRTGSASQHTNGGTHRVLPPHPSPQRSNCETEHRPITRAVQASDDCRESAVHLHVYPVTAA